MSFRSWYFEYSIYIIIKFLHNLLFQNNLNIQIIYNEIMIFFEIYILNIFYFSALNLIT